MDRDILVFFVVYVDCKEGILQVSKIIILVDAIYEGGGYVN